MSSDLWPGPRRYTTSVGMRQYLDTISLDGSPLREGSFSLITAGDLYTLLGNQAAMKIVAIHNVNIDERGNFMGRDETDTCGIAVYCEDNTFRFFGAPSALKGTMPVFTRAFAIDLLSLSGTPPRTGCVGEVISATIATPGTTLTTATPANVILTPFLALTAGDWDVWGEICFLPAATTSITQTAFGINSVSATLPAANSGLIQNTSPAFVPGAVPQCDSVVMRRISIAAPTTYYLVAQATFTIAALSAFGTLYARRVVN